MKFHQEKWEIKDQSEKTGLCWSTHYKLPFHGAFIFYFPGEVQGLGTVYYVPRLRKLRTSDNSACAMSEVKLPVMDPRVPTLKNNETILRVRLFKKQGYAKLNN